MKAQNIRCLLPATLSGLALFAVNVVHAADPLPSWNDTATKKAITTFVGRVTQPGSPDFVPVSERIATFDNDGTLWSEQPMYIQMLFALDRVKALAPRHPEWKTQEPFASLLKGDVKAALAGGEKSILEIVMATHAGMTTEEFERIVTDWIATAKHPVTGKPLTEMVHHDDAKREYEYGATSHIGTFSDALMAEAKNSGWTVISMKEDWKRVFPK